MKKIVLLLSVFFTCAASAQSRNSAKTKEFPLPLQFDVVGQGLELTPLVLQYDLQSSQGNELVMGPLRISPSSLRVDLRPANRLDSRLTRALPAEALKDWVFLFQWPENLMQEGTLEFISRTGRVLWSVNIDSKAQEVWQSQLDRWSMDLAKAKISKEEIAKVPLFQYQYGIRHANTANTPFWSLSEPFRICFSYQQDEGQTRICTAQYEVTRQKNSIRLDLVPTAEAPPRVILMNETAKLADQIEVPLEKPVQFYAELRSGFSFEFVATPHATHVVDMVKDRSGEFAWLTIESENAPLIPTVLLNQKKVPEWVEWIGWQQTIGDFRKYWRSKVSFKDTSIMVSGTGGGVFRQNFVISKLPREEIRPYTEARRIKGTYTDNAPIRARKPANVQVTSSQNSVDISDNKEEFVWKFGAKKRNELNRSYLEVNDGENTFRAYHEVFKGYPREISARLSGIATSEDLSQVNLVVVGELAFNYWFEDLLGWSNYYVRQRLGLSGKAFRSLMEVPVSGYSGALSANTLDMKYRLNPGLWGRDESWGILGSYQSVKYDAFEAEMVGGGIFWARSMPKIFEDLTSWFPLLNYPKWVDFEFIYYVAPLSNTVGMAPKGIGNWALNFHGQIMFTKNFFGEAGFGLKQYDFSQPFANAKGQKIDRGLTFTTSYGTIGCGFKF